MMKFPREYIFVLLGLSTFLIGLLTSGSAPQGERSLDHHSYREVETIGYKWQDTPVEIIGSASTSTWSTPTKSRTRLLCTDRSLQPLWKEIVKDKYFPAHLRNSGRTIDCADQLVIVDRSDINGNGIKEFVVQGRWGKDFCGMYSGCWLGIYEQAGDSVVQLFSASNVARLEVGNKKHFGYKVLVLRANGGPYGDYVRYMQFDGRNYRAARCFLRTNLNFGGGEEEKKVR